MGKLQKKGANISLEQRFHLDMLSHVTVVPDILLSFYQQLGLSAEELVWLLQALKCRQDDGRALLTDIASATGTIMSAVKERVATLEEKNLLSASDDTDYIYLEGLFNSLFDLWAFSKMAGARPGKKVSQEPAKPTKVQRPFAGIYSSFEKELGRGLSPIENEKLVQWLMDDKYSQDLVTEALRRAVLQGKVSFAYIDKILLSWERQGLRSIQEIKAGDKSFAARSSNVTPKKEAAKKSRYNEVYDKMLKS